MIDTALVPFAGSLAPECANASAEHLSYSVPTSDRDEFESLPFVAQNEISELLRILKSVAAARCRKRAFLMHAQPRRGYTARSLARKFRAYIASAGNWRVLKNESRLRERNRLPVEFVSFVQAQFMRNKRVSRQGWLKLRRYWEQGCDDKGRSFVVPGYGTWQHWWLSENPNQPLPDRCPGIPRGWSYENLMRKANRLTRAQEKMAREGSAAARAHAPHVLGTRDGLRFLELVTFDDVKTDFRVIDISSGQVCDLWLLVAFDRATAIALGYGMRPARARDDGSQEHLKLIDMKQLAGWVLQTWGIPASYDVTWKLENGCATLPEATALALRDLSSGRINVSYASMINGISPAGYKERAIGNSRAKASHESHNNLLHNMAGDLPGQTGRRYDVRPADLGAREAEAVRTLQLAGQLSPERRGRMQFPILTLAQAREELNRIFHQMNSRTVHDLEGFEEVILCRPSGAQPWQLLSSLETAPADDWQFVTRRESPYERMTRLVAGAAWSKLPQSVLVHFYRDSQRIVSVDSRGEISFAHEKRDYIFMPANDGRTYHEGDKFLAYFHPRELDFIHLTQLAPHSGYVSTWVRRERVRIGDDSGLAQALRYTQGSLAAQTEHLHNLCKGEAEELQAMRNQNAQLVAEEQGDTTAIEVQDMHAIAPVSVARGTERGSGTGAALDAADRMIADSRARAQREADAEHDAAIREFLAMERTEEAQNTLGDVQRQQSALDALG